MASLRLKPLLLALSPCPLNMGCNSVEAIGLHGGGCAGEEGTLWREMPCFCSGGEESCASCDKARLADFSSQIIQTRGQNSKLGQSRGPTLIFTGRNLPPEITVNFFQMDPNEFWFNTEYGSSKALYFTMNHLRLQNRISKFRFPVSRPSSLLLSWVWLKTLCCVCKVDKVGEPEMSLPCKVTSLDQRRHNCKTCVL